MTYHQFYLNELKQEAKTTRKMLKLVPTDKFDWQPHPKSMTLKQLATHLAELPGWVNMAITTNGIDFSAMDYEPARVDTTTDILDLFETSLMNGSKALKTTSEEQLNEPWIMRQGETIISESTKSDTIRMSICQTIHHRAQLGVYLRLLNIPIPGSYGPSADDPNF